MSAAQKPEQETAGTAVARTEQKYPAHVQQHIEEQRQRNAVVAAIRGTMWGKDLNPTAVRAVAQYAQDTGIDPVRHIEILGGRIYLTAELYQERGAALVQAGVIQPMEPELISHDSRLDELAKAGDQWAKEEATRRLRQRIKYGVPDKATAAWVTRIRVTQTGAVIEGCNWCGGGSRQRDPVGDAEPTKTALTRSWRRTWKQITEVVPQYASQVAPLEARATLANAQVVEIVEAEQTREAEIRKSLPPGGSPLAPVTEFGDDDELALDDRRQPSQNAQTEGL